MHPGKRILRAALAAATLLLGAPATLGTASAATSHGASFPVMLSYTPDMESFGPEYALHTGAYAKAGLDVTLLNGDQYNQVQEVLAGKVALGIIDAQTLISAVAAGAKFTIIGAEYQRTPLALTCRKNSGISKISQVKGKTIGVRDGGTSYLQLLLSKNGMSLKQIKWVPIGATDISEIVAGKVDCIYTSYLTSEPQEIASAGVPVTVFPVANYGLPQQDDDYFVKQGALSNPTFKKEVVAFMKATADAWNWSIGHPRQAATWLTKSKVAPAVTLADNKFSAETQAPLIASPLTKSKGIMWLDPSIWAQTTENLYKAGITKKRVNMAPLLTNSVLAAAGVPKTDKS